MTLTLSPKPDPSGPVTGARKTLGRPCTGLLEGFASQRATLRPMTVPRVAPATTSLSRCFFAASRDPAMKLAARYPGTAPFHPYWTVHTAAQANEFEACPDGKDRA